MTVMRKIEERFLNLVRYALGTDDTFSGVESPAEWDAVYALAESHALIGVCASGIERMDDNLRPPLSLTMKWAMNTIKIEKRNATVNKCCVALVTMLAADGFRSCVLKGQGAALLYPEPQRRQSGDIDVWVSGSPSRVMAYVRKSFPAEDVCYHHIDYPVFGGVPVELHFTPSWMSAPRVNRRLQAWFKSQADQMFSNHIGLPDGAGHIPVPTVRFNVVYMLLHIYRHLFSEGIGLRQCMDYYYVLKAFAEASSEERDSVVSQLRRLGLWRFAGTMMYVLREAFHAPDSLLIVPPRAIEGCYVLNEIMSAGNFGRENGIDRNHGRSVRYFVTKFSYRLHFFWHYPNETVWGFFFTLWNKAWCAVHRLYLNAVS